METTKIKEKDIVILRFDSEFPVSEADLFKMMKTIRQTINKDSSIADRFICLAKGIDIETMSEDEFIQIWKSKWGHNSFDMAEKELNITEEHLAKLAEQKTEAEMNDDYSMENILGLNGKNEVELNSEDEQGNTWKPLSDEDYEKAKKGEL
tara:strand:+ start:2468 stop:2920 length:453 start_codon:yes stop_codon:yes gene_type:complete